MSRLGLELEWDDEVGDFRFRREEEMGKHKDSSSSRTRMGNQNERRGRAHLADATANTTPYESRSHTPLHLANYNNRSHSRSRSRIREQPTHYFQSAYPTEAEEEEYDGKSEQSFQALFESYGESFTSPNVSTASAAIPGYEGDLLSYADQGDGKGNNGSGRKNADEAGEESLQLLNAGVFQGFGGGVTGQWHNGKWI
jgi:hypothetical protein